MCDIQDISKYIINWCYKENIEITNIKLQLLLYFTLGDFYYHTGKQLFNSDLYTWDLGVYQPSVCIPFSIYCQTTSLPKQEKVYVNSDIISYIDNALLKYANNSAVSLIYKCKSEQPWIKAMKTNGFKTKISFEQIAIQYENRSKIHF